MKLRKPMPVTPRPQPAVAVAPPVFTQAQLSERRRKHLPVYLTGTFDLAFEVRAIVKPLAKALSAEPHPRAYDGHVADLAAAVHEVVSGAIGFIAERDGAAKVKHLAGRPGDQQRAVKTLADMALRPPAPVIADDDLPTGAWAAALVDLAKPYSQPLAEVLAAALPPGDDRLKGSPSTSERLEAELRELDRAARLLQTRIDRSKFFREQCPTPPPLDRKRAEAEATLAELGVSL